MSRRRSIVLVLLWLLSLPVGGAALSFLEPAPTPLVTAANGKGAVALATADLNGDGKPDLAVIYFDSTGDFVAVMLNNGNGTFQAPAIIYKLPPGLSAGALLAKDFDGDGKIDLAVGVSGSSNQILWFKGHGDGGFDAPLSTSTNHAAHGLQTADLNHDGVLDLVALNSQEGSVSVLLGVGDGTFQAPTDYVVGTNPLDVAIGDVDGINGPDLVVGNYDAATIGVLLNHGDGTFGSMVSFNANMKPQGLYLADFDRDNKLDVVAAGDTCSGGNVDSRGCMVFMKGDGNGGFAVPTEGNFTGLDTIPIRRHQVENVAPDLNGDGTPDVVFVIQPPSGLGGSQVMVGLNKGDGTFSVTYWVGAPPQPVAFASPDAITGIATAAGDFDGDGVLDLALATQGRIIVPQQPQGSINTRGGVSILFGDTPGTFDVPRSYAANYRGFALGPPRRGGVLGDFTGKGNIDLVVVDASTDALVASPMLDTFRGNGDGTFQDAITALPWTPGQSGGSSTLRAADLGRNGTLDLVFFGPQSGIVAAGYGDGTFTNFSSFSYAGGSPLNMVLADFNGDGYPDLAILESGACISGNAAKNIEVLLQGAGTKTFVSKSITSVNATGNSGGSCGGGPAMVAGDFDKDGKIDLVVTRGTNAVNTPNNVLLFKGKGDGTFAMARNVGNVGSLFGVVDLTTADLRRNGNLDLIGVDSESGLFVMLGKGNGTFQAPASYGAGCNFSGLCEVKIADFDGDGIPDIAVVSSLGAIPFCCVVPGSFAVLRGKGDGTFEAPVKFAMGFPGGGWLDIADLNGDGLPDVVVGHAGVNGNGYTVLINDSTPPTADLVITMSDSPDPVTLGTLTYTITVTNSGPDAANGVSINDSLPGTLAFVSVIPSQGNCIGTAAITCSLGSLSKGSSATVTIIAMPTQIGGISNTATATANERDADTSNNTATQVTAINAVVNALTGLSPAKIWVGRQSGRARGLTWDLLVEVLANGATVGTGQLFNAPTGGSTFSSAVLDTVPLTLNMPIPLAANTTFSIRVSVRVSCSKATQGVSATGRLWYNGKPTDTGKRITDAGSRFAVTLDGVNTDYFLRTPFALATTAGSSKQSIDVAVDNKSPCPARPFTPFGTWSVALP